MLQKETEDKLNVLGFDVSKLYEAIKAEVETSLEVPELYTKDQRDTYGKNLSSTRFDEGKNAMDEIRAKGFKKAFNIESESKDLDTVINLIIDSKIKELGNPNEKIEQYKGQITELQGKLESEITKGDNLTKEYQDKLFKNDINSKLLSEVPKESKYAPSDLLVIYNNRFELGKDDGRTVVKESGTILKDNLLNPIEPVNHFKAWLHENKYVEKSGMNGKTNNGGSSAKFKDMASFMEYCDNNGIEPMGEEGQNLLISNKEF